MSTPVIGIYHDPMTSCHISIPKTRSASVEQTITDLSNAVIVKVNKAHNFDPPLSLDNMSLKFCPSVDQSASLHSLGDDNTLIALITPESGHADLQKIRERWDELDRENKALEKRNTELEAGAGRSTLPLFGSSHFMTKTHE